MADIPHNELPDDDSITPASTLFLEMMRRAAERRASDQSAAPDASHDNDNNDDAAAADSASPDTADEDTPHDSSFVRGNLLHPREDPVSAEQLSTTSEDTVSSSSEDVDHSDAQATHAADHASDDEQPIASDKSRLKKRYSLPDFPPASPLTDEPDFLAEIDDSASDAVEAQDANDADDTVHDTAAGIPVPMPRVPIYEAPVMSKEERASRLKAQRVRRLRRRKARRHQRNVGILGGFLRTVFITIFTAGLVSTIFTWFTRPEFIKPDVVSGLQLSRPTMTPADIALAATPTPLQTPNWLRRIGVVSGHRGPEGDPGAVTEDGLTEAEINFAVATEVVGLLRQLGYTVDLLDEFDPRLDNYKASALVSIHANNCPGCDETISGFLVSKAAARPEGGIDTALAECIAQTYGDETGIPRQFNLTVDMTDYHTFREIHPETPAAILELGYMIGDRDLLTTRQQDLAQAIVDGVDCFFELERSPGRRGIIAPRTPTPTVTPDS